MEDVRNERPQRQSGYDAKNRDLALNSGFPTLHSRESTVNVVEFPPILIATSSRLNC